MAMSVVVILLDGNRVALVKNQRSTLGGQRLQELFG